MEQNRVKRGPYNKEFLGRKSIYYHEETPSCLLTETTFLNLETMDVIYTP